MKRFILFLFFLIFFVFPQSVHAQEGWVIEDFRTDLSIQRSGIVTVSESITVDFGSLEKHGIFRDIPYVYKGDGGNTYTEITPLSVRQDTEEAKYEFTRQGDYVRFKIGDPDETISGTHTYTLRYEVKGVLRSFDTYDELYWNVTGNYWEVPIRRASATVTLPGEGILQTACYTGGIGSTTECMENSNDGGAARFEASDLSPEEGLTVAVGYEKGMVSILTVARPKTFWEKFTDPVSLTTLMSTVIFGLGTTFFLWYSYGRDSWFRNAPIAGKDAREEIRPIFGHETVVVEFTPPENLRPAEIGVLNDERAHTHDVTSTIIDLATRGYLTVTEVAKKWMFGKTDYILTQKKKDRAGLLAYEKLLLDELFSGRDSVNVSDLKLTFYQELARVKKKLYEEVVRKKLFPTDPEKVRNKYLVIAVLVIVAGIALMVIFGPLERILLFDIGAGTAASGGVLLLLSKSMPRRTAHGRNLYRRVKGYKLFLSGAEQYRQQFFEKKNLFNEVLPYVIVFRLTDKFADAMKEIGLTPQQPAWYRGTGAFNTYAFGRSMSTFSSSVGSAIAAAPSSSGSGGGGSSGGGFGGGGGGSW